MATKRPEALADYIGQDRAKQLIRAELDGGTMPRHILLYGRAGLGKTSLSQVMAREAGLEFHAWKASKMMTQRWLQSQLMSLSTVGYSSTGAAGPQAVKHLVFIDEIHDLPVFETLYEVLEDRVLNPDPFGGISWLPLICFVVATTNPNVLPKPFADRFALKLRLDPYSVEDLGVIASRAFPTLTPGDAFEVARRSRGTARVCVNLAESVLRHGLEYFGLMGIDEQGCTELDRLVVETLTRAGRPLALNTLANMVQEEPSTIRDVVEPYLITLGLMEITPKGRQATAILAGTGSRGVLCENAPITIEEGAKVTHLFR